MEQKGKEELQQKMKQHDAVLLKYPKNIRQVGDNSSTDTISGQRVRIYVEDYVMTYAMHLASGTKDGCASAVLLGQRAMVEGRRTMFISGAVELPLQNKQQHHQQPITGQQWTAVYDQMQKYFHGVDIMGWFLTGPGLELTPSEDIQGVWSASFGGADRLLFLYDSISREEAFYTEREKEFIHQSGYYIYYEKNEEMQNYIIDIKGGQSTDEGYEDNTAKKIRDKILQKNEQIARKKRRALFGQQVICSVGIVLSAAVLAGASTKLYYSTEEEGIPELQQLQETISRKNSVNKKDKKNQKALKQKEIQDHAGEAQPASKGGIVISQQIQGGDASTNTASVQAISKKESGKSVDDAEDTQSKGKQSKKNQNNKNKEVSDKNRKYVVKKGDTLESISISCYGTRDYIKKIKKLNKLESVDKIYIGQTLLLP